MKIVNEFDYRNGKRILEAKNSKLMKEIIQILNDSKNKLDLKAKGKQRDISSQIQRLFLKKGWNKESPSKAIPEMKYDLAKENVVIEIEIGHKRLVYADFFEFLADYSQENIDLGIMIVTGYPLKLGHTWHNSLESTKRKILAIKDSFLVPIWVIAIDP